MSSLSSSFKLSDNVDQDKVFLVNLSEIEGRIDPQYYFAKNKLDLVNKTVYPVEKISHVLSMQRGRFGHRPRNDPAFYGGEYPFIQTGNIVKANLRKSRIRFNQTLNEKGLKTSRLFDEKVVVFTIAANIGYTAILDYPACFPDSLIAIKPKGEDILLEYIDIYLSSIRKYIESLAPQAAQKNINYQQLALIPFVVPPIDIQNNIIEVNNRSISSYKTKSARAKRLLDSIDNYLLAELDIKVPDVDNSLSNRIFTVQASELLEPRLDPEYLAKKYRIMEDAIKNSVFESQKLSDVTYLISSGRTPAKMDYVNDASKHDKVYDIIKVGSYSQDLINSKKLDQTIIAPKFEVKKGDIFILSAAHQSEYVGKHIKFLDVNLDNVGCVGELICVRANNNIILNSYLFSVLKTDIFKTLINRRKTGQTSHVYPRDIRKIEVPVPNMTKQQEIVEHIDHIRSTAASLQQEANDILVSAKQQIENMILGKNV